MKGKLAGCVVARCTAAASTVNLSSFGAELETCTLAIKTTKRVLHILEALGFKLDKVAHMFNDNEASIAFIKGEGMAKAARHMELRLWYVREQFLMGGIDLSHMPGTELPADRLTKPSTVAQQNEFVVFVMGQKLL